MNIEPMSEKEKEKEKESVNTRGLREKLKQDKEDKIKTKNKNIQWGYTYMMLQIMIKEGKNGRKCVPFYTANIVPQIKVFETKTQVHGNNLNNSKSSLHKIYTKFFPHSS